ncbi:MAG: hypothetical protein JWQ62_1713 [Lacunisphaera sp.]|nr:hypothetical protein [Lacunisphaera sp.]
MKNFLLGLALLGVLATAARAEKIELGGGKALLFTVPESWKPGVSGPPDPTPVPARTVRYVPKDGRNEAILLTALPVPDDRFADPDALKALVGEATQQFVADSVEKKANLKELRLGGGSGYAVTFTDAKLVGKPSVRDDYKAMTSCFVYLGERVMVTATIFTDDPSGPAYAEAQHILKSVSLRLPGNTL